MARKPHRGQRPPGLEGPVRQCTATRTRGSTGNLLRFVVSPEGVVTLDLKRNLPGRGAWVGASAAAVAQAIKRKAFTRAFKVPALVPATLNAQIDEALLRDCLQSLAMANKAGLVASGFFKVEAALRSAWVLVRVEAVDGAADGRQKLDRIGATAAGPYLRPETIELFQSSQMSLALGRENVIHAVALAGAASDAFVKRCRSLEIYRTGGPDIGAESVISMADDVVLGASNEADTDDLGISRVSRKNTEQENTGNE